MQEVLAELQQWGAVDPAAQDRLMEDLRQSDPSIWPLVMQQFRATEAYRRRAGERAAVAQQDAERLPPIHDTALAALESPPEPPSVCEPFAKVLPVVEETPNQVTQASYPAPAVDDWPQRLADTKEEHQKLSDSAPLMVRNLAFCTEVQSYGCMERFEEYAFQGDQEVLLYAEVEGFAAEPTPQGYHTSLKSSYQIFDAHGRRVAERAFAVTEEYCQNARRDYFIGYRLRMPKEIGPGHYRLFLSIEDLKRRKTGQAMIEFEIKE